MQQKYYFYTETLEGLLTMAEGITQRQAQRLHSSFSRSPSPDAKAWGWAPEDSSLSHQIRCKKATQAKIVLAIAA